MTEVTGFLDLQVLFLSVHFFSFLAMPRNVIGWITASMGMSLRKLWEMVKDRETWHVAVMGSQRVRLY